MSAEGASGPSEDVGSVGEEAAKLFEAFTEALAAGRDEGSAGAPQGPQEGAGGTRWSTDGLAALAADAIGALRDADLHVATGGEDCRICPVCRAIHAVRETTPEVRAHLATAARALLAAGGALVDQLDRPAGTPEAPPPRPGRARRPAGPGVERIDLDRDQHDESQHDESQHDESQHDQHGTPGSQEEHR